MGLIVLFETITADSNYAWLSDVTMKRGVLDCIVDGIFQVRTTLTAGQMDITISGARICKRASRILDDMRGDWQSLKDVCQLFCLPSHLLLFEESSSRAREAILSSQPAFPSTFENRSEDWKRLQNCRSNMTRNRDIYSWRHRCKTLPGIRYSRRG